MLKVIFDFFSEESIWSTFFFITCFAVGYWNITPNYALIISQWNYQNIFFTVAELYFVGQKINIYYDGNKKSFTIIKCKRLCICLNSNQKHEDSHKPNYNCMLGGIFLCCYIRICW